PKSTTSDGKEALFKPESFARSQQRPKIRINVEMSAVEAVGDHSRVSNSIPTLEENLDVRRQYSADATLLLVGCFGAGKKTLGIIASVALRRRFIDFDSFFKQEVQSSPQEFITRNGLARYRDIELEISRNLLTNYEKGCVIVGLGGTASSSQRVLLTEFSRQHPVVYVRRDERDLQQLAGTSPEKFTRIFDVFDEFFESCSNFDFFNHSQGQSENPALPTYLKLKETERVFVAFLHRLFGKIQRPIFSFDPSPASHTYSLQVPLAWLDEPNQDFESLEAGVDAITLLIKSNDLESRRPLDKLARHISKLRTYSRVPIIADVTALAFEPKYLDYSKILLNIPRLAPDALACSHECGLEFMSKLNYEKGHTKIIGTFHEASHVGSKQRSLGTSALLQLAEKFKYDAIRVTGESTSASENLSCVSFSQKMKEESKIPVVSYNTGPLGHTSVCLNPTLSPVVLQSMQDSGITVREAQQALSACFLLPKRVFTIFGKSVKYTLSPAMHNTAYKACGLPHIYEPLQTDDISDVHKLLDAENQGGVIVSLPYKSAIMSFLDEVSPDAKDINAVNTVVLDHKYRSDGQRVTIRRGYNTDYIGIRDCIDKHLSPANAVRDGTTALIIGAGGMARAAVYACYELGVRRICIYNRTTENAQKLRDYYHRLARSKLGVDLRLDILNSTNDPWPSDWRSPAIVTSCIPPYEIGSERTIDLRIPEQWLTSRTGGVFLEVGYGPLPTKLMEQMLARASKGWVVVDGLKVLIEQGIVQYEILTKRPAPVHLMRRVIQEHSLEHGYAHR
ncbi:hypothetical protein N7462_011093, partial [Penicillium macrosclerotiorum]|uniref:uncharacterized protein n=1 Tax=Penicillium macrosclerotiorum TaxID=303699 RepID=UPI002547B9CE